MTRTSNPENAGERPLPPRQSARNASPATSPKAGRRISDVDPDEALRRRLVADLARRDLRPANLHLDVTDRAVTIHGDVGSADERERILDYVRRTSGIVDVHDAMRLSAARKGVANRSTPRPRPTGVKVPWVIGAISVAALAGGAYLLFRSPNAAPAPAGGSPYADQPQIAGVPARPAAAVAAPIVAVEKEPEPVVNTSGPIEVYRTRGHIQVGDKPTPGAFIVLHPLKGALPRNARPNAIVRQDGSFELTTFTRNDGAPVGEYAVTVEWRKLQGSGIDSISGPNLLPDRFSKPETSGLRVKIDAQLNEIPPLKLTE